MGSSVRLAGLGTVAGEKWKFLARWVDFQKVLCLNLAWKKTTSRLFDLSRLCRSLGRFETKETHEVALWQVYTLGCLFIFGSVQMRLGCFYLSFAFSFSFSGRGIWWCQTLSHHVLERLTLALVVISLLLQRVHKWFYLGWRLNVEN